MRRFGAAIIAALLVGGLYVPAAFAASPAAHRAVPKVVFIVGPAGAATSGYRAQARSAATIARQYTPDVVELYSPNATWTAVKDALKGASLVVYMGHGNGWPSRYRDSLYPITQDGFGLNPTAGGGDYQHQYFGEASIASEVKLARNAVVLMNHLCYASGNSEPGLPEGTLDVAKQRVDNYAAGFIRAGASAVIAEAWSSPSYFVRAILGGGRSIQTAWLKSPSANGHRIAFSSERSPGYVAQMDPASATSGFERSIVMKSGLAPKDVLAGAAGSASAAGAPAAPLEPSLSGTGLTLGVPDIASVTTAGSTVNVGLPFTIKDRKALPKGLQASVRWDPIALAIAPVDPATEVAPGSAGSAPAAPGSAGSAPAAPGSAGSAPAAPGAKPSTAPASAPAAKAPPGLGPRRKAFIDAPVQPADLVVPEAAGDVIAPTPAKVGKSSFSVPVTLPSVPGHYRLTVTLHDGEGEAYDDATQAMLPALNVRVTGDYDMAVDVVPAAQLTTSQEALLGIRVTNIGKLAWGHGAVNTPSGRNVPAQAATVVGRWLPLSPGAALDADPTTQETDATLGIPFASGQKADSILGLTAPSTPGDYLLLLDVITPERGSLVALGADPTLVRITVVAPG